MLNLLGFGCISDGISLSHTKNLKLINLLDIRCISRTENENRTDK